MREELERELENCRVLWVDALARRMMHLAEVYAKAMVEAKFAIVMFESFGPAELRKLRGMKLP